MPVQCEILEWAYEPIHPLMKHPPHDHDHPDQYLYQMFEADAP